jgi:hypothetical protein
MTEPGFVKIVHPQTGGIAEVPRTALPEHYRAGWRLITDADRLPTAPGAEEEPAPVTAQEAAVMAAKAGQPAEQQTTQAPTSAAMTPGEAAASDQPVRPADTGQEGAQ